MLAFAEALRAAAASVPPDTERRMGIRALLLPGCLGVVFAVLARALLFSAEVDPDPTATPEDPVPASIAVLPETPDTPLVTIELSEQAALLPAPVAPASPEPVPRRPSPLAAWHRALDARTPDVQRCADEHTGSVTRLAVAVTIDATGQIAAHVADEPDNPLSRCIARRLASRPLTAPRKPTSLVHVFELQVTFPEK
jgi:hypothetical protein